MTLSPKVQADSFKYVVLSDKQSKTQRHSIYKDMKQRKAENSHTLEWMPFFLDKWQLSDYPNSWG